MAAPRPRGGPGGRPPREAASPSTLAPAVLRWATARGLDATLLASRGGLEHGDAERDEAPVTSRGLAAMLDLASEMSADPHVGLRLPSELAFRRFDAGALAARVAATPTDVLDAIARYAALVFPRLEAEVTLSGGTRFDAKIVGAPRGLGHHVDEYVLAFALGHCRRGGAHVVPRRAWLTSARPAADLGPLVRALGTDDIELGSETTGLLLDAETARTPLTAYDPMLVSAAEHLAAAALATAPRPGALSRTVASRIEATLPDEVTAEAIASGLKMSARTLQRRLEDEGLRFSTVLDEVRGRVGKQLLLETDRPLTEIAARLGFSDLATFSRAFKRWTGVPPGTFRRSAAR